MPVMAADYIVTWMQLPPTADGGIIPNNSTFNLPGVGSVQMSYAPGASTGGGGFSATRYEDAPFGNGSVDYSGDTYSWGAFESLLRTHLTNPSAPPEQWTVTYTFQGAVPAGNLALGIWGLGRTDLVYPNYITTATIAQNGTELGQFGESSSYGGNLFTQNAGSFSLQNSIPGDTSTGNPAFNSCLALVRIDDSITSLTVTFWQIGSDGTGVDIGFIEAVPEPSTWIFLGLGLAGFAGRSFQRRHQPVVTKFIRNAIG